MMTKLNGKFNNKVLRNLKKLKLNLKIIEIKKKLTLFSQRLTKIYKIKTLQV